MKTKEEKAEYGREWRKKNPDYVLQYNREYYEKNKERLREYAKAYRDAHIDERRAAERQWRLANPDRIKENNRANRRRERFKQHGIAEEDYLAMMQERDGLCDICRKECPVVGSLSIDHDHSTGRIRGLLCKQCNSGLGFFRDSCENLARAIDYLTASRQ